jgi:hypothetical protein
MLTPGDGSNHGSRRLAPHAQAANLAEFLQKSVSEGRRDVREIASYFAGGPFRFRPYGDDHTTYLTQARREEYFAGIPDAALRCSVVFFDPDNGLEPSGGASPSHLKYDELRSVLRRMDDQSIAVVYQHLPRQNGDVFWPAVAERLSVELRSWVGFLAAGDVAFYCVVRSPNLARQCALLVEQFAKNWPTTLRVGPESAFRL